MAKCDHEAASIELGACEWNPKEDGLCSRYTGHELKNGRMVISLVVTSKLPFLPYGHAHVVFEWRDNLEYVKPEKQESYRDMTRNRSYRKHKVFHLLPKEDFSGFGVISLIGSGVSGESKVGVIKRGKADPKDGMKQTGPFAAHRESGFFDFQVQKGMSVSFRSWCAPFDKGWKAFSTAKENCRSEGGIAFQLVGSGSGDNCLSWSQKILVQAGIHVDGKMPSGAVSNGVKFVTEAELKSILPSGSEGLLASWARGVPH